MNIIKKKMNAVKQYFLKDRVNNCKVGGLETSLNPMQNLKALQNHTFTTKEIIHYSFLSSVWIFVFFLNPAPLLGKLLFYIMLCTLFIIPLTSQFFFSALPILTWLGLYFTSATFNNSYRRPISVKALPAVETILYGDNLSDILANSTNHFFDILAWIPYGLFHFGAPFVVAIILFLFGPPRLLRGYAFAFGYMNLIGVIIQSLFPSASPWYKNLYGIQPANYGMKGSPGGLRRIDEILGIDLYSTAFANSAVIFGALPSLHSGCATMEALFFSYVFPKLRPVFIFYVCWLWWSTMYLTHHYFVDLVAGATLSFTIFQYTKYHHLPKIINDPSLVNSASNIAKKIFHSRWAYSDLKYNNMYELDPLSRGSTILNGGISNDLEIQDLSGLTPNEIIEMNNFNNTTGGKNVASNTNSPFRVQTPMTQTSSSTVPSLFDAASIGSRSRSSETSYEDDVEREAMSNSTTLMPSVPVISMSGHSGTTAGNASTLSNSNSNSKTSISNLIGNFTGVAGNNNGKLFLKKD
ncbi:related to Inositol phosphorylceramide synthase catalytic subunit AUR1 [Saccharomycodes ludwigii]|uniref:Related to Inositol phosphorylceramide synthase catalytic subunit AUR1 n=1 Tax=Saccharomycodes ludwigii TaxID=36035 RepID=A0A376BAQ8_9ASCO|nr:hypothetical protein SCDLUD_002985 [Saccharomycodes ludwigii]KAH3901489.1 hypothetical protein SCDLUD_002985 [Saccharomycodes ludwigii]SSD61220.1 related to Inositol phosphorylceramide synthase catalytic subunit AUR1 [Saccharomycodes ludwigii]